MVINSLIPINGSTTNTFEKFNKIDPNTKQYNLRGGTKPALELKLPDIGSLGANAEDEDELDYGTSTNGSNIAYPRSLCKDDVLAVINGVM